MVDFLVIGAGSAGCVLAAELVRREAGSVLVLEAGPSERHPLVTMPFGLVWLMRSRRDWAFRSAPMAAAGGRQINIPRGRMVGGSGSINSMVWFRGRVADFDAWQVRGWSHADVCLCRPKSRGTFRLSNRDARAAPVINLGLFRDDSDLDTMVAGLERLRELLARAEFGIHRAKEAFPGPAVTGAALKDHLRQRVGTAYHPVGTLRMGQGPAPVSPRLGIKGVGGVWVADASVMPAVTSANTNAPSMMIGWKGAEYIVEDAA